MKPIDKLSDTFKHLKRRKKKAFIPFIMAGDPDLNTTARLLIELEKGRADVIEVGIPFSDPLADGPTIQESAQYALSHGVTPDKVLRMLTSLTTKLKTPIALLTYYNLLLQYGSGSKKGVISFLKEASRSGVSGIVIPDLPVDESKEFKKLCSKQAIAIILLAAPTSTHARLRQIASTSEGFIYYVSVAGTTGVRKSLSHEWLKGARNLRRMTSTPICVGFGISTPNQAKQVASVADGVIIGSALTKALAPFRNNKTVLLKTAEIFMKKFRKNI